jgi:hypothetical protein
MILFKKKLILIALFTLSNSGVFANESNNACPCIECCQCNANCEDCLPVVYESDKFDTNAVQSKPIGTNEPLNIDANYWKLKENCQVKNSFNLPNSTLEITDGASLEYPFHSMVNTDYDNSTLYVNSKGKYIYQSNNFNSMVNGTKVIFSPFSNVIWNGLNYRLFDAKNTNFIAYPYSFINALRFDVVHKHNINYLVDGNNKSSTFYLNRVKFDNDGKVIPNHDIMAVLLNMNIVLPKKDNNGNDYKLQLDKSKQFLYCDVYPNLYFENCKFIYEDYKRIFTKILETGWKIRTNDNIDNNDKKAVLSQLKRIKDPGLFTEYDVEFEYATTDEINIEDKRPVFVNAIHNYEGSKINPTCYNQRAIKVNDIKYNCYWDLKTLHTCFKDKEFVTKEKADRDYKWTFDDTTPNKTGILNYLPPVIYVGLLGDENDNTRLINIHTLDKYSQVELYGVNKWYDGKISASPKTEKIIFGEDSYAYVDQLFAYDREKKVDIEFQGSNNVKTEGQTVNNFIITKDAKNIVLSPADNLDNARFDIEGAITLEDNEEGGSLFIKPGVKVNA